jgi:preprotein translocase subunit SecD
VPADRALFVVVLVLVACGVLLHGSRGTRTWSRQRGRSRGRLGLDLLLLLGLLVLGGADFQLTADTRLERATQTLDEELAATLVLHAEGIAKLDEGLVVEQQSLLERVRTVGEDARDEQS